MAKARWFLVKYGKKCRGIECGGIAQLGAQVTSKTTPNLAGKIVVI